MVLIFFQTGGKDYSNAGIEDFVNSMYVRGKALLNVIS